MRTVTTLTWALLLSLPGACGLSFPEKWEPGSGPARVSSGAANSKAITSAQMRATLEYLADPKMKGRRTGTAENREAGDWLAAQFEELGLEPAVGGSWFHYFEIGPVKGRNVAGILRAQDNAEEYVVVGAHYDGIGERRGSLCPAADDNASGVAALLEIAEAMVGKREELKRHLVFVSYDAEELGLLGSRAFVRDQVIPSEQTVFMLVFDLIGGRFFPWRDKGVVAMGSEHSRYVRALVSEQLHGRPTPVELAGTYILEPLGPVFARSDYQAYRAAGIPYLFLSTGTPWYYHRPEDTPERVDFQQVAEIAVFAHDVIWAVATSTGKIDFIAKPGPEVQDLLGLERLCGEILQHRERIDLSKRRFAQIEKIRTSLQEAIARQKPDRYLAQRALIRIFGAARRSGPKKRREAK